MSSCESYNMITKIPLITFLKGDTIGDLVFNFENGDNVVEDVSLTGIEPRMYLFPIGYPDSLESFDGLDYKIGIISTEDPSECSFIFSSDETRNLRYEKYQYYIVLYFLSGKRGDVKRVEGEILFKD